MRGRWGGEGRGTRDQRRPRGAQGHAESAGMGQATLCPVLRGHQQASHSPDYLYDPQNSGKQAPPPIQLMRAHVCGGVVKLVNPAWVPWWPVMNPTIRVWNGSLFSPGLQGSVAGAGRFIWEPGGELLTSGRTTPPTCPPRGRPLSTDSGQRAGVASGQGRGPGPKCAQSRPPGPPSIGGKKRRVDKQQCWAGCWERRGQAGVPQEPQHSQKGGLGGFLGPAVWLALSLLRQPP